MGKLLFFIPLVLLAAPGFCPGAQEGASLSFLSQAHDGSLVYGTDAERDAEIAESLGAEKEGDEIETSQWGGEIVCVFSDPCGMPSKRSEPKIPCDNPEDRAGSDMTVTRRLKNYFLQIIYNDALAVSRSALQYV